MSGRGAMAALALVALSCGGGCEAAPGPTVEPDTTPSREVEVSDEPRDDGGPKYKILDPPKKKRRPGESQPLVGPAPERPKGKLAQLQASERDRCLRLLADITRQRAEGDPAGAEAALATLVERIGRANTPGCAHALAERAGGEDDATRRAVADALERDPYSAATLHLVNRLEEARADEVVRQRLVEVLRRLSGQPTGADPEAWRAWHRAGKAKSDK